MAKKNSIFSKNSEAEVKSSKKEKKNRFAKKKKRRFFSGFAIISVLFVFVVVLVAGAFTAWDIFAKEPTGLTLIDAFGLIKDVYADGSAVVTNPYDKEEDLKNFYANLKGSLYLAEDCEINISDILSGVLGDALNGNNGGSAEGELNGALLLEENIPEVGANGSITGNEVLDSLLEQLEFDFSSLKDATDDQLNGSMLELSDKQLAAVLNESFASLSETDKLKEFESKYGIDIDQQVSIQQVIISNAIPTDQTATTLDVTLKINLREALNSALSSNKEQIVAELKIPTLLSGVLNIVPALLPETLYVTATAYPNNLGGTVEVNINNLSEAQQKAINGILDKYLKTQDSQGNTISMMTEINNKIIEVITKINELLPISFVSTGSVQAKPIQAMINALKAENLTQGAFLAMVRDIKFVDKGIVDEMTQITQQYLATYAQNFIDGELLPKYFINNEPVAGEEENFITATNLFTRINTLMSDKDAISRIEIKDNMPTTEYGDGGEYRPQASYQAVALLINGYLENSNTELPVDLLVKKVSLKQSNESSDTLEIVIELNLLDMINEKLGDNATMKSLVSQIIPSEMYLYVDYTQNYEANKISSTEVVVSINGITEEQSEGHYNSIMSIMNAVMKDTQEGLPTDYSQLEEMLNEKLSSAFISIGDQLGRGFEFEKEFVILPNLYEVLSANEMFDYNPETDNSMTEEEFNAKYDISAEELFNILKATYKYSPVGTVHATNLDESNSNIKSFVEEIDSKYYIDTQESGLDWSASAIQTTINTLSTQYSSLLRMTSTLTTEGTVKNGMATDTTAIENLKPFINQYEFATIVNDSGSLDNIKPVLPTADIEFINIYVKEGIAYVDMRIKAQVNLSNTNEESAKQSAIYSSLFPETVDILVQLKVEGSGNNATYSVEVGMNGLADTLAEKMLFFVKRISGTAEDLSKQGLETEVEAKIKGAIDKMSAGGSLSFEFTQKSLEDSTVMGGAELDTVFALAINNIYEGELDENKPSQEVMRSTIQKLYNGLGNDYSYANGAYTIEEGDQTQGGANDATAFNIAPSYTITGQNAVLTAKLQASFMDAYMGKQVNVDSFAQNIYGTGTTADSGDISYYQLYVLPGTESTVDEENTRANDVRNTFGTMLDAQQDYMVITFKVNTSKMSNDATNKLIPQYVYINAVISIVKDNEDTAQTESSYTSVVFNNITSDEEKAVLEKLLAKVGYNLSDKLNEQELSNAIMNTQLVNYSYTYAPIPGGPSTTYNFTVTVADMLASCEVRYCSNDGGTGEEQRKQYIIDETAKSFESDRYGLGYLYFEEYEERTIPLV